MDAYSLHKTAMDYAEKVWQERGDYVSTYYATITVLISDGGHIYTGITGITVNYGDIEILRSEKGAMSAMLLDGQTYAKQMVTISFKSRSFAAPSEDALKLLYELDHRNANCEIMTDKDTFTTVSDIIGVEYDPAEEETAAAAAEAPAPAAEPEEAAPEVIEEAAPVEEAPVEVEAEVEEEPEEEAPAEEEAEVEEEPEEEAPAEVEAEVEEEPEEEAPAEEAIKLEEGAQPDFLMGFDFGDDTGPTSEIVVPKVQKSYEEYDKKNAAKRTNPEFSDGVTIDESNPFFDAGSSEQKEVVAFADKDAPKTPSHEEAAPQQPTMSKKEMLKMAKKRKKIAKNNNKFR